MCNQRISNMGHHYIALYDLILWFYDNYHYRMKELEMHKIIREILSYLLFLNLLMMVAYGNRDPYSFRVFNQIKMGLVEGIYDGDHGLGSFSMHKVIILNMIN